MRTPWEQLEQALAPAGFEPMASKPFSDKPWGSSWKAWGPPKGWTGGYMDSRGASSGMGAPPDQDIAGAEKLQLLQEWEEYGASFGVGGSWGEYLDGWGAGARGSNRDWVSAAQQRMWGEVAVWRRQHDRWLQYQRQQRPEAEQGRRSLLSLEEGEEGTMPPQAEPPGRGVGSGPGESAGSEPAMVTVPPPMRGQVLEWAVQEASCNAGDVEMLRAALVAGLVRRERGPHAGLCCDLLPHMHAHSHLLPRVRAFLYTFCEFECTHVCACRLVPPILHPHLEFVTMHPHVCLHAHAVPQPGQGGPASGQGSCDTAQEERAHWPGKDQEGEDQGKGSK